MAEQRRHDQHHRDEGQAHVHAEQDRGDDDHRQALDRELRQAVLEQLLQVLDVARHAAHEHAGLLGGEEVERQALQMGEHRRAEIVHHPRGEAARDLHRAPAGAARTRRPRRGRAQRTRTTTEKFS